MGIRSSFKPSFVLAAATALLPLLSSAQGVDPTAAGMPQEPQLSTAASITVDASQTIRTVDDRMFGVNAVMWDGNTASSQTIDLVRAAGLRFFRIPGGSVSDEYHWAVNRSLDYTWSWAAGLPAFAALTTAVGAQTTAVVNYGTGTPEEAAAWVAYENASASLLGTGADMAIGTDSNGVDWKTAGYWSALRASQPLAADDGHNFLRIGRATPIGVAYWEIGNECFGSWETDHQIVPHDPYTYATRAKDYIAKMKAVDPTIHVGVVAVTGEDSYRNNISHPATNPRTGAVQYGWTPVLLSTLASLGVTPDALIYHRYDQNPGRESDSGLLQGTGTWANDAQDLRQQLSDYLGASGAGVELVVTENNSVSSDPGKQSTSIVNGLFYADTFGNVLQTEFDGYLWWALRNGTPTDSSTGAITGNMSASLYGWRQYGDYGILSSPNTAGATGYYEGYPVYDMMKLVSHFARGGDIVVKAASSSALLSAYAVKRANGTLGILVINKDPANDIAANLSVTGFDVGADATVYSYGVAQDDAARTGTGINDVVESTIAISGPSFPMSFARYTAAVLSLSMPAPVIVLQPASVSTGTGANVALSVVATGASTYQWRKDGAAISGATDAALQLSGVGAADAGSYDVVVRGGEGGTVTSSAATVTVSPDAYVAPASQLVNLSTLATVGSGGDEMIAGFTIGGQGAKKVLVRAIGPTLTIFGISGELTDPQLDVTTLSGTEIASNDDWGDSDAADIIAEGGRVGAFPLQHGSKDAVLILTLPPGTYTAAVKGARNTTGTAIVEVYDLDVSGAARLINLSTRARVGGASGNMTGGFVVQGAAARKVLVRAVGPTLGQWLPGTLADPELTIKLTNGGSTVVSNDDWGSSDASAIIAAAQSTGAFPLQSDSKDAAILTSLDANSYSAVVAAKSGDSGVGMVEIYEAP